MSIVIRKNPFSDTSIEQEYIGEELLSKTVPRVLEKSGYDINSQNVIDSFQVVVNGHTIDKELWSVTKISEKDNVLIAPIIKGGSSGQIFKQVAVIVIAVLASAAFGPAAGASFGSALGSGLVVAGVTIAGYLALNALIPPLSDGFGGLGALGDASSFNGSQMYSITSQQNSSKKFGTVPRVYGSHRIFPYVAASPYTELEPDPETGNLVQFFYCVYDLGFGPAVISNVRIGETFIGEYSNSQYRLVDFNKPLVSEGPWDDALHSELLFYKGDNERDGTTVVINDNQIDGGPLSGYQFVRNASSNVNGCKQEIILDFVMPQGLIAYEVTGETNDRWIDLKIEFSKASEDVWRGFSDPTYVDYFSSSSGTTVFSRYGAYIPPFITANYQDLGIAYDYLWRMGEHRNVTKYGWPKGNAYIDLLTGSTIVGDNLYFHEQFIGVVASIAASPISGHDRITLVSPLPIEVAIFEKGTPYNDNANTIVGPEFLNITIYSEQASTGFTRIQNRNDQQIFASFKFSPKEIAAYKVRVTRVFSSSPNDYQVRDALTLASISTRFDRNPIITNNRHVFMEVKVKATNQLNGAITNLSAVVSSVLDVYDGANWNKEVTNNPAWVFADLMTGEINPRAIDKSRLDTDSLIEWADFCEEIPTAPPSQTFDMPRFSCNFVFDYAATLQQVLSQISNAAQASLTIRDGRYGVLIDKLKTVPVQIFTPRNSSGFKSSRSYQKSPDALKIKFIDPNTSWGAGEIVVYDDGFDELTATDFDELATFACTNAEQAWRFGRYMLAQARLRRETIFIEADFEYLVCTRGDFVQVTSDVMKVGGTPARVKSVTGNQVVIDDSIETGAGSYGYVYRSVADGIVTNTLTVVSPNTFDLDGTIPAVGDLIIIGEVGQIVFDCIVKSISPSSNLTASLVLVEKADAIYDSESTDTLPDYDPQIAQSSDAELTPTEVVDLRVLYNTWRVVSDKYQYYITVDWDSPLGPAYQNYEVYVDSGKGYNLVGFTKESIFEYIVNELNLDVLHKIKVLAVSANGKKLNLIDVGEVTATPLTKTARPSNVPNFSINITNQVIQLDWDSVPDEDIKEYLIRFSPDVVDGTWETSTVLLKTDKNTTMAATQGRTGIYSIKAYDLNRNESEEPTYALTTIPKLFDLNIIDETSDFPTLGGEMDTVEDLSGYLHLRRVVVGMTETNQYYPNGYYYLDNFLDLGEIYTVRLQSLIYAEGFTIGDLMENWPSLDLVDPLSAAVPSSWNVKTQYRATDSLNVMGDWVQLSLINPISEGVQDNWSVWRDFTIGDATGRIFQFRINLISNVPSVTPRVANCIIKSDMPDRFETYNDQSVGPSGLTITYSPSFKGPGTSPNIQVTQDNASQGDYYILENKTLDGFKITFYDKDDIAVTRTADVAVKGYGRKYTVVI